MLFIFGFQHIDAADLTALQNPGTSLSQMKLLVTLADDAAKTLDEKQTRKLAIGKTK
jgi:hypothetical protein